MRLDAYLAEYYPENSRSTWQKYILSGRILVNGIVADRNKMMIGEDDVVTVSDLDTTAAETIEFNVPVIYEDDNVLVLDKPIGMLSHAKGGILEEQTIADVIRPLTSYCSETNRPGIIHRLDRDTSGVIVTVKNPETASMLQRQFTDRKVKKTYIAIVKGSLKHLAADIDLPIERDPKKPSQFRIGASGKVAKTSYKTLAQNKDLYLIELQPETGRTHQLRVHMAYVGAPIYGDKIYGKKSTRMFLHAHKLEITIPTSNRITFSSSIPPEFAKHFPLYKAIDAE